MYFNMNKSKIGTIILETTVERANPVSSIISRLEVQQVSFWCVLMVTQRQTCTTDTAFEVIKRSGMV